MLNESYQSNEISVANCYNDRLGRLISISVWQNPGNREESDKMLTRRLPLSGFDKECSTEYLVKPHVYLLDRVQSEPLQ